MKEALQDLFEFRCSKEDCNFLERDVTEEEVRKVLFSMPAYKSPGQMDLHVSSLKLLGALLNWILLLLFGLCLSLGSCQKE